MYRPHRLTICGVAAGLLLVLVRALSGWYGFSAVCEECGALRYSQDLHVPLTRIAYFTSHSIEETAVSKAAMKLQLVGAHQHRWLFIGGSGSDGFRAWGSGGPLTATVDKVKVATFLENAAEWLGQEEARECLKDLLDATGDRRGRSALDINSFPDLGFSSRESFEEWRDRSAEAFRSGREPR